MCSLMVNNRGKSNKNQGRYPRKVINDPLLPAMTFKNWKKNGNKLSEGLYAKIPEGDLE